MPLSHEEPSKYRTEGMGTNWSSKPLSGAGCGIGGGFDSHALPPIANLEEIRLL
jgi:hypothetical protein